MATRWLIRWGPAAAVMLVIFMFSSRPSNELPDFGSWDYVVKKSAHMLEYGLLAVACWRGFEVAPGKRWAAWAIAVGYAITDEVHQSFVPGRFPSLVDVGLFDNLGAILALFMWNRFGRNTQ